MIRNILNFVVQNKNFIMTITSIIYILGIFAYFNNLAIPFSIILSVIALIGIIKNFISPKIVLIWILIFYAGFLNCTLRVKNTDTLHTIAPKELSLEGQIVSIPNSNFSDKTKFFFETNMGKTYVSVHSESEDFSKLKIGNYYKIKGKLRTPFEAVNPSQFDYGKYLKNYKTFTVFYSELNDISKTDVKLTPKWLFLQNLNDIRNNIIMTHSQYLKSPNLEILGGIVFGDDAIAPPDWVKNSFINAGLLHILAASGMNVAFIYGFWYFILRKIFKLPFKITVASGIGVIILYSMMTGLGASVIRATFMLIFILIGKLLDRDSHSIALLSMVAMLMLIYNPSYINDVGFQLSFLVTFGILTSAQVVFEKLSKLPNWLSGAIFIPIIAQIWVAPLQMFYFNTFSLYSIFANISIAPILSIISFGGFISSVIAIIKPISNFSCMIFDYVLNPLITSIISISNYFSHLPNSLLITTHPSVFQVVLYYIIILLITLSLKIDFNKKLFASIILSTILLILSTINFPNKNLEIIAFSVQNADAFLIKTPKNKYFMIDTAKSGYNGGKSQAEIIILKYLKDKGIRNLEGMIITHFDNDHSGGAVSLFKNLKIKNTYVNNLNNTSKTSKEIYEKIKPITLAENNHTIYSEPDFKIKTYKTHLKEDNDNSIITLIEYKKFKGLFMGDAGIITYKTLKSQLPKNITLLKIGHHGAKGVVTKEMLHELNPKFVIISTGKNMFNHPHLLTLNELRNTKIYRTDKDNSIKIISSGEKYEVLTFNKILKLYKIQ